MNRQPRAEEPQRPHELRNAARPHAHDVVAVQLDDLQEALHTHTLLADYLGEMKIVESLTQRGGGRGVLTGHSQRPSRNENASAEAGTRRRNSG
jgi:hypothetical protein